MLQTLSWIVHKQKVSGYFRLNPLCFCQLCFLTETCPLLNVHRSWYRGSRTIRTKHNWVGKFKLSTQNNTGETEMWFWKKKPTDKAQFRISTCSDKAWPTCVENFVQFETESPRKNSRPVFFSPGKRTKRKWLCYWIELEKKNEHQSRNLLKLV